MSSILLTGAGGFAGAHTFEHLLMNTSCQVTAVDSFRHKGQCNRLARVLDEGPVAGWRERTDVITHDLAAPFSHLELKRIGHPEVVIAMASESHVERSIADPVPFVRNNVDLMLNTLELCRAVSPRMVIVISTDEVYGPIEKGQDPYREWSVITPSNPYAASKAAQEALAFSYWRTYGVPVVIVNCMNLVGEMQDPEKFAPMVMRKVLRGEMVSIHGTAGNIGSRSYIHARNLADALLYLIRELEPAAYPQARRPERFNIAGLQNIDNLTLAQNIASFMSKPLRYGLTDFHSARPGHDPHYGLSGQKLHDLGWRPPVEFWDSMERMVRWTVRHPEWLGL